MKYPRLTLSSILLLLPFCAFAHGEEAILPFFYMVISGVVFAITMLAIKLHIKVKAQLFFIYAIASFLCACFLLSRSYRDYLDNETLINVQLITYPVVAVLLGYVIIKMVKRTPG